jgi:putative SOS response-associated peptidase YedK
MCGRFVHYFTWQQIHDLLRAVLVTGDHVWRAPEEGPAARYNQAPTQMAPIVIRDDNGLEGLMARWDFVPFFFKQPLETKKWTSINAKVEEILEKPAFRTAIKSKRCLVPNNGFYEWKKEGAEKIPYWIRATDSPISFFGGLWDYWEGQHKGETVHFHSFAVLTCAPNSLVAPIHNRMPVIIRPEDYETWMFGNRDDALKIAHDPYPAQMMIATPVDKAVGNVKNDYRGLLGVG